jgi:hypothetical protein
MHHYYTFFGILLLAQPSAAVIFRAFCGPLSQSNVLQLLDPQPTFLTYLVPYGHKNYMDWRRACVEKTRSDEVHARR